MPRLAQFAYITSHDLQEPARKISTFVEMLDRTLGANVDQKSKNYIQKIDHASAPMLSLIRGVLSISQLSSQHQKFEEVNLNNILNDVLLDYELLIDEKSCVVEINDDLPVVEAIPVQMSQLITNLMSNALKFCKKEEPLLIKVLHRILEPSEIISYQLKPGSVYSIIEFADNGIGFQQENAAQIFSIFQRLHGRTEYEGTGIGLAMCKK